MIKNETDKHIKKKQTVPTYTKKKKRKKKMHFAELLISLGEYYEFD